MELYHLRTFVKVADEGNLTRASQALFTSQPAISAQIKALEEELGVQLFSRTPRGMQLTQAGQQLYRDAQTTLGAAERLRQTALKLRDELVGELRVGMHTDYDYLQVGALYRQLASRHPRLVSHFLQSSSATVLHELRQGQLDAGFMFGPCRAADVAVTALGRVEMKVVAPASWAERIKGATLEQIAKLPWVYSSPNCPFYLVFEKIFEASGTPPPEIVWCDNEDATRTLVRAGAGLSVVKVQDAQRAEAEGYGVCWQGAIPDIELSLVMLKQRAGEPALQALKECVCSLWQVAEVRPVQALEERVSDGSYN